MAKTNKFGETVDDRGCRLVDTERWLRSSIKADQQQLDNAPLGPIQKKRLAKRIQDQKLELKELNRRKKKGGSKK